jgi:hypothetical protein
VALTQDASLIGRFAIVGNPISELATMRRESHQSFLIIRNFLWTFNGQFFSHAPRPPPAETSALQQHFAHKRANRSSNFYAHRSHLARQHWWDLVK